jgi:hypothetical protein
MEAMTKHRSHDAAFKRQFAEEFIAGETLYALSKQHDISGQLIRIWVGKFEVGALDDDVKAADLMQEWRCCSDRRAGRLDPRLGSGDADGVRASQLEHAVEDMDSDAHLGRLAFVGM